MVETVHGFVLHPVAALTEGACAAHREKDRSQMIEIPWSSAVMRALDNGAADVVVTLDGSMCMRECGQQLRVLMR
ncbi:hypothetical protein [Prosthecobacter sp.]|jgi:hypothetical protein|uniref:hypothetical protein n=1 Tax=Prosthecobacter sp. TaxID=1965333 RepID=UPI0037C6AA53